MDDLLYGVRDKRGRWRPNGKIEIAPIYRLPPRPLELLKWLPGYFIPWNVCWMATATLFWFYLTPSAATLQHLHWSWVVYLFARNIAAVLLFYGALELRLYVVRAQGTRFKYNPDFPSDSKSKVFWFGNQNLDNAMRSLFSGVPIWTAYEVFLLWSWANGYGAWTTFAQHPVWLICFGLLIPVVHEAHFFCIHRLIHIPILYRWIHSVHHNSVNPSPWSSLSMHPVEHLLYWSGSLIHFIVPSHPLLAIYHLHMQTFGAVVGHVGFEKMEIAERHGVDTHAYTHYLHHKYFEVNYGDGLVPMDKLFGTWHDGTPEGDRLMQERFKKKQGRLNASAEKLSV